MLTSKLEVLVDFGGQSDDAVIDNTLKKLKIKDGIKQVVFKDGSFLVETTLPSSVVVDLVADTSGRRAVLQGFGETQSAVAMVSNSSNVGPIIGVVRFQQSPEGPIVVDGTIDGLPQGFHGLHIHESGDLSQGCLSIGGHYNPTNSTHGSPQEPHGRRHAGDLGNIVANKEGRATFRIIDNVLKVWDIIGRSVAVSERVDDLGKGDASTSLVDGNSGEPLACGIIARSAGVFQNTKRICACDGVVVWDERDRPIAGSGRRERDGRCCAKEKDDCGKETKDRGKEKSNPKECCSKNVKS